MRRFVVIGIGADGWGGLGDRARREISTAEVIYGSARQLALIGGRTGGRTVAWSSPMSAHLSTLLDDDAEPGTVHVLASGDPMFHGIGSSIVKAVGRDRVTVLSAPSSVSLATARMGWDLAQTGVVSLVTGPPEQIVAELTDGARLLVLSRDGSSPARLASILRESGYGRSTLTVLGDVGGPEESLVDGVADGWAHATCAALNVVAVDCRGPVRSTAPGSSDDSFRNDGQLTKHHVRALTVCALRPAGGQTLWDVGAGAGSVGVEWACQTKSGRVVAVESDDQRAQNISHNAASHGVSGRVDVVHGLAPGALAGLPAPDAVFIGGGLDAALLDLCWSALRDGGRIVVNAVAMDSQQLLMQAFAERGGELTRLGVERAGPLGTMTTWRPALPIVQWVCDKEPRR
ncbi:MAG: precorrin-6y C5,15-methyltransferase (decarboxylating) subunit CbiE [Gordonia sp. (in: high G+C Gram-positive bacteria)]